MRNSTLLAIDCQIDFHDVVGAALPVDGAVKDTERIAAFIKNVNPTAIVASLDTHYTMDIAHPQWWTNANGSLVDPFTSISHADIQNGKYTARFDPTSSHAYVKALEDNGEFTHMIWPLHCLQGSEGHALHPTFLQAIQEWETKNIGSWTTFVTKGVNPMTEMFGIFRANVPLPSDPSTNVNQRLFNKLNTSDQVFLVGQARSHCVANSLKQLVELAPQLASKVIVLEDCMSNVPLLPDAFYDQVDALYATAKTAGVKFAKSTDF